MNGNLEKLWEEWEFQRSTWTHRSEWFMDEVFKEAKRLDAETSDLALTLMKERERYEVLRSQYAHKALQYDIMQKQPAQQLAQIYFDIAANTIGEDEVRRRRDEMIEKIKQEKV